MSKYDFAIQVLAQKALEVGGKLYTRELVKKDEKARVLDLMLGGLLGEQETLDGFTALRDAIEVLERAQKTKRAPRKAAGHE
jgi:hypothetical protein